MKLVPLVPAVATPDLMSVCRRAWSEGHAVLPLDPRLSPERLKDVAERFRHVPEGVAVVLLTSGTTGDPKAVMLGHDALRAAARLSNQALGASAGQRWLACVPLHHVAGFGILMRAEDLGTPALVHERFEVQAVRRAEAKFVSLVPTMLKRLLDASVDLTRTTVLLGGARIPVELLRRADKAGIRVVRSYGMTETCGGVVYDGVPLAGVGVEVGPGGRIAIASPTLMLGYHSERAGVGLEDGRFITSDRGRWVDGKLEVLGRLDRTIITGGENVSADEVEALLLDDPAVHDAYAFGAPDEEWGQKVVALVVAPDADIGELLERMKARAAAHQVPKQVLAVDEIPRTASGAPDTERIGKITKS